MTTPAINIDVITTVPNQAVVFPAGGGPSIIIPGSGRESREQRVRPASSSANINLNGFRECKPWSHSGLLYKRRGDQVTRKTRVSSTGPYTTTVYSGVGSFWNANYLPPAVPSFPSSLVSRAEMKALSRLNAQDFNLGVFLAELTDTRRLFEDRITSIARTIRQARAQHSARDWLRVRKWERGNLPCELWHKIPAWWLETQYGWKPLMADIMGAITYLDRKRNLDGLLHVTGYASDREVMTNVAGGKTTGDVTTIEYRTTHQCWVSMYYKLIDAQMAELSSLGLINPAAIVWELLRFSFIVDWAVPIGGWLNSITADAGFEFYSGSVSRLSKMNGGRVVEFSFAPDVVNRTTTGSPLFSSTRAFSFSRSCLSSSPVPGVYVKNPLSVLHVSNALALLAGAFR